MMTLRLDSQADRQCELFPSDCCVEFLSFFFFCLSHERQSYREKEEEKESVREKKEIFYWLVGFPNGCHGPA